MNEEYLLVNPDLNIQMFEKFRNFDVSEHSEIEESLDLLPGGAILSVKFEAVAEALADPEVEDIRNGFKKMPKSFQLESVEDFWKIIAIHISLEEYS